MDENKMQRQMEFLVEWQAQFAAKLGVLEGNLTRQGENIERLNSAVEQQGQNIQRVVGIIERFADIVARLTQVTTERFEAVDRRDDETDRKIAALVDSQIQTEESIRNLSATVDRHISEGHNGRVEPRS